MSDKKDLPNDLKESASKIWLAGLGALAAAEEEGSKLFKNLVAKGEQWESKGRQAFGDVRSDVREAVGDAKDKASSTWGNLEGKLDDAVSAALQRFGVPSRDEIATLTRRVEELTSLVEGLKQPKKPAARPAPGVADVGKADA
jgi:poly(hydroxyalkanoate) granule-associated protein